MEQKVLKKKPLKIKKIEGEIKNKYRRKKINLNQIKFVTSHGISLCSGDRDGAC